MFPVVITSAFFAIVAGGFFLRGVALNRLQLVPRNLVGMPRSHFAFGKSSQVLRVKLFNGKHFSLDPSPWL